MRLIGWKDSNCQNENDHRNYDNRNLIFDVQHDNLYRSRNEAVDKNCETSARVGSAESGRTEKDDVFSLGTLIHYL